MKKLRSIQVLRGVAACAVVLLHAHFTSPAVDAVHSWARLGAAGVDLFFVISGFIMATIPKPTVGGFLFDRFWRVMPFWWVVSLPWLLIVPFTWPTLTATLTLWPAYAEFTKPALGVGWTLSFEVLFYLAVALSLRTSWKVPFALFGAGLISGLLSEAALLDWIGNPIIFEFLFGAVVARLPRDERLGFPLIGLAVALFALSPLDIYPAEVAMDGSLSWVRVVFWGFPAALLVYGCLCAERYFARVPVVFGDASYSIYLAHLAVVLAFDVIWPVKFALGVVAGLLLWWFVERPILRAKPASLGEHLKLHLEGELRRVPKG